MDWTGVVRRANTIAEVLEVLDEFTSSLPEAYWQSVADVDLERWHHGLVKQLAETRAPGKSLQELCRISLHAVARIHQIRLHLNPPDDSSTNDNKFSAAPDQGNTRRCA